MKMKLFATALVYLEKGRAPDNEVDLDQLRDRILDFESALQNKMKGGEEPLPYFLLPRRVL